MRDQLKVARFLKTALGSSCLKLASALGAYVKAHSNATVHRRVVEVAQATVAAAAATACFHVAVLLLSCCGCLVFVLLLRALSVRNIFARWAAPPVVLLALPCSLLP